MRKFFPDRTIVAILFVFTFLVFVLAQQYTMENGPGKGIGAPAASVRVSPAKKVIGQTTPAAIIVR